MNAPSYYRKYSVFLSVGGVAIEANSKKGATTATDVIDRSTMDAEMSASIT